MWWKTYYLAVSSLQNRLTGGKVYQSSGSSKWANWPSSKLPIDLALINSFFVDFRVVHYKAWALGCHQPFRVLRKCTPTDARSQKKITSIDHSCAHAVFYSRRIIWCEFFSLYFLSAAHLFISHPSQLPVSFSCFAHFNRVSSKYLNHSTCRSEDDNKYILGLLSDTVKEKRKKKKKQRRTSKLKYQHRQILSLLQIMIQPSGKQKLLLLSLSLQAHHFNASKLLGNLHMFLLLALVNHRWRVKIICLQKLCLAHK